jgi:ADP-ribose pyrophosphatase YjhB (NUDIX family)
VDTPRTYVGAYALCVREGQLLLARMASGRVDAGRWTLPGGGLAWGEDPAAGALRELAEETGLTGTITGLAGVYSNTYLRTPDRPRDPVHHLGIVYTVAVQDAGLRHEVDGSTDQCAWVRLPELDTLPLVPLAAYAATLYNSGRLPPSPGSPADSGRTATAGER